MSRPESIPPPESLALLPVLEPAGRFVGCNKPSGMLTHRGWDRDPWVAMTVVRDRVGQFVHPIHRLDRATSGVLLFALDPEAAAAASAAFERGLARKTYIALVRGHPPDSTVIDHPVRKKEKGDERVPAVTELHRLAKLEGLSLVEARPRTGRLHQIRRHLKHLGHPIAGDVRYGKGALNRALRERIGLHRLALHALHLELPVELDGATCRIQLLAPLPEDLCEPLRALGAPVPTAPSPRGRDTTHDESPRES